MFNVSSDSAYQVGLLLPSKLRISRLRSRSLYPGILDIARVDLDDQLLLCERHMAIVRLELLGTGRLHTNRAIARKMRDQKAVLYVRVGSKPSRCRQLMDQHEARKNSLRQPQPHSTWKVRCHITRVIPDPRWGWWGSLNESLVPLPKRCEYCACMFQAATMMAPAFLSHSGGRHCNCMTG